MRARLGKALRTARWRAVNEFRALPDYLVIGAQKGGTSSLHHYLGQHPQVVTSSVKEVHYFDIYWGARLAFYKSQFPYRWDLWRRARRLGKPVVVGESTPNYLFHPHAAQRIHDTLPDVKLIALLRDPVARAYSHYQMARRWDKDKLDFPAALAREQERLPEETARMLADERYRSEFHQINSFRARGVYVDQLQRYWDLFDRNQMLVLPSEPFFADPQGTFDKVTDFLNLSRSTIGDAEPQRVGRYEKAARIPLEDELRAFYAPHNERLYELLGEDFGW